MNLSSKLVGAFYVSDSNDLSADEGFRLSFLNVVNAFALIYSLLIGINGLVFESFSLALVNLVFCCFFISHFILAYIIKRMALYNLINYVALFIFFVAIYISGNMLNQSVIMIIVYPFIALILHGRRNGIILSFAQLVLIVVLSIGFNADLFPTSRYFSVPEITVIAALQLMCIFVYYAAIRWMTNLIYDSLRDNNHKQELLQTKTELLSLLIKQLRMPLDNVRTSTNDLARDHLNTRQEELLEVIKTSTAGMQDMLSSIQNAAEFNIRPVEAESKIFNIQNLVTFALKTHACRDMDKKHVVVVSPELPQEMIGNSSLTRQILLGILNGVNQKIALANTNIKILVSLSDIVSDGLSLNYSVGIATNFELDKRDLSSPELRLIEIFDLDMIGRLVRSQGGEFKVGLENGTLQIDFTLAYKNATDNRTLGEETFGGKKRLSEIGQKAIELKDATVMVVDDNEVNRKIITMYVKERVKNVIVASGGREALHIFENNKVDVVLMDLQMPDIDGFVAASKIRQMESGSGRRGVILGLTAFRMPDNDSRCAEAGMDGCLSKPFSAEQILSICERQLGN